MRTPLSRMMIVLAGGVIALCGCEPRSMSWQGERLAPKPKDADEVTIVLGAVRGAEHSRQAAQWRDEIERETGWKNVFVVDQEGFSQMCWSKYPSIEAARSDLKKAKEYVRSDGTNTWKPFISAAIQVLPGKPVGPPEWDLTQQKDLYVYTVEVGVFYDMPERTIEGTNQKYVGRKQFAVDFCKELRDAGFEAYYFHGPSQSSVTVGLFPRTSMQETPVDQGDGVKRPPVLTIIDERIRKILTTDRFKYLCVNGRQELVLAKDRNTGQPTKVARPCTVLQISKPKTPAAPATPAGPANRNDLMTLP
ncbi:MAG: hypothetical protein ABFD92_01870 [Planctomycetaceae bacterium]|nr:hypothetical protein [Planctomycetaceae bacterium]